MKEKEEKERKEGCRMVVGHAFNVRTLTKAASSDQELEPGFS